MKNDCQQIIEALGRDMTTDEYFDAAIWRLEGWTVDAIVAEFKKKGGDND